MAKLIGNGKRTLPTRLQPSQDALDRPTPHPMSHRDMIGMIRVDAAAVNTYGQAVFSAKKYDFDAGKFDEQLYLLDIHAVGSYTEEDRLAHKHICQLTGTKLQKNNTPQFSPDGDHVAFLSNRTGSMQVFVLPVRGVPGEARQLTDLPNGVSDLVWDTHGSILFSSPVYVDDDDSTNDSTQGSIDSTAARIAKEQEQKSEAVLFTSLPVRQWDRWLDAKMNHIFMLPVSRQGNVYKALGPPRDLLKDLCLECPVPPFGGREDFALSSTHFAASARPPLAQDEAWSTNRHIFLWDLSETVNGSTTYKCITESNVGYDTHPKFSPDGSQLAWLSMETPQYEADAERIKLYDIKLGTVRTLAVDWDYSPSDFRWSRDGKQLLLSVNMRARLCLCAIDVGTEAISTILAQGSSSLCEELSSGHLVYTRMNFSSPVELWTSDGKGTNPIQLTFFNHKSLSELTLGKVQEIDFIGAKDEQVQAWLVLPAGVQNLQELQPQSVPMAVVIHGGPQSAIMDAWHYRWHLQTYAAKGFVTLAINFHGSTGFGHEFTRSISGDWGGAPYEDIIAGCRHVLSENPCIDPGRVCALGASYGGFMINFINGHAPADLFKCLVCHDGVFSFESSYYSTEELFFMEYEFKGVPWEAKEGSPYQRFSPHLEVAKWKTPTLVIHGAKDYRLVETEGIAAFQALQRQGVPSALLLFPSENHWVMNPLNSLIWHDQVLAWLDRWVGKASAL